MEMDFSKLADEKTLGETMNALNEHNIETVVADNSEEALSKLRSLVPNGAHVMTGASATLDQIGFTDLLKSGNHPWVNLKDDIVKEKDLKKQAELRRTATLSDYFIGSVHAITRGGHVLIASASGSQIPSYAFSSPHVIWIAGTQKIVSGFDEGIKRIEEYCFPVEDKRMKGLGAPGSSINEILIIRKSLPGRIRMVFVRELLGV